MQKVIRMWYENNLISLEHINLKIKQIYVWVISKDNMIVIVTKSNGESQFPGGHPEQDENPVETAVREVNEEAGLDISSYLSDLKFFGYYLVEKNKERYLQLRYLLLLPMPSDVYSLSMNEKNDEERPVASAQWVELLKLPNHIPWTNGLEEYKKALDLVLDK